MMEYDKTLVGEKMPSNWVFDNKRGVCAEYSTLLAALLRVSGIPTRYVIGYAYTNIDKDFIPHAWVEVLSANGEWIPFDPTWLQGGYVDATHVKTANLIDGNHTENMIRYSGGKISKWTRPISEAVQTAGLKI